jgi:hypothetical protein
MTQGTGPTFNKFTKPIGNGVLILEVGEAPHQWTIKELKEILKLLEKPADIEVIDVSEPDAKRGPGRPRAVGTKANPAGKISTPRSE